MSIATAIAAAQQKVANAYSAVESKGGTLPQTQNLSNLPDAISSISGGSETRFGLGIGNFIGELDENGYLQEAYYYPSITFTGVKNLGQKALYHSFPFKLNISSVSFPDLEAISGNLGAYNAFYNCSFIITVDMSSLVSIGGAQAAQEMFYHCFRMTSANLSSLKTISGLNAASKMFASCSNLLSVDLHSLEKVDAQAGGMLSMFEDCNSLASIDLHSLAFLNGPDTAMWGFSYCGINSADLSSLQYIKGNRCFRGTFNGCSKLPSIRFPMLLTSDTNSWSTDTFQSTSLLTEIHFRKDMEDVVPTFSGYSTRFGAPNATIYFDLVGHIVVNGVTYMRSEHESIYSGSTKQYVAWLDANITDSDDNVYTRDYSKDTLFGVLTLYGWTLGSTTVYTTDREPSAGNSLYTDSYVRLSETVTSAYSERVYTAFDNTTKAEPAVGTTVYSDAGQTSIGTITTIA